LRHPRPSLPAAEVLLARPRLRGLTFDDCCQLLLGDAVPLDRSPIDVQSAVGRHRAHRQFRLLRSAKLSRNDHVQLGTELPRDRGGHRDAAARDAQDEGIVIAIPPERGGERGARRLPIPEQPAFAHHASQPPPLVAATLVLLCDAADTGGFRADLGSGLSATPGWESITRWRTPAGAARTSRIDAEGGRTP
jgi:hypothetical protein